MLYVSVRMGWVHGSVFNPQSLIKLAPSRLVVWWALCVEMGLVGKGTWDDLLLWLVSNPSPRFRAVGPQ